VSKDSRKTLGGQIRHGVVWSTLDVAVNRTGGFLLGLIVARLLDPHDFGIYAVALVVHAIVINVSDLGVGTALVRDDEETARAAGPTVATIALATSVVLGVLMALSASSLARLLGAPTATSTIEVMAITLPLAGVAAVPTALLRRGFRMDTMFVADTANTSVSALVVILLAVAGWGPLSLAWSFVAGQLVTTVILLFKSPARFWPGWDRREARRLLRFGVPLVGANVLGYSIQNVDYIIVGRVMGAVSLGFYMLAFNISGWPQNVFSSVVRNVSLPAFSRLREQGADMAGYFTAALRNVARVTLPVCLFLAALAHPLVVTVYGSKWGTASTALVGLAVLGAARTILELLSDFLVSLGRTRAVLFFQVAWLPALIVALLVLVHSSGIAGAGYAHAAVSCLVVVPLVIYLVRRAGVPSLMVIRALLPALGWAAATAWLAWYVASQIRTPLLACAAGGTVATAVYVLPYLTDARRAFATELARRRANRAPLAEAA
jgi:PST family polysaccharide transporter